MYVLQKYKQLPQLITHTTHFILRGRNISPDFIEQKYSDPGRKHGYSPSSKSAL